ncbi:MAG: GMC oxidoreductase, partial [Chloroflexota bacterium]|nr:GMC oxidoreductase [Chloroflexota bacterium]
PDYRVQPRMHYNYLAEPFDRERLRAGVRLALDLAQRPEISEYVGDLLDPKSEDLATDEALDRWLGREATTYSHISCTCRMGPPDDEMAVVDQFGRVQGMEGLRIVDASIMPDLVRSPINPAVIMLAEKIADAMRSGR